MLGDITSGEDILRLQMGMGNKLADVVLSDIAPEMSGDHEYDHKLSNDLNQHVIAAANRLLKPGGNLLIKAFYGSEEHANFSYYQSLFKEFTRIKPNASRKRSSELYYLGKGFKLSEYFKKLQSINQRTVTFDEFYELFPKAYTKSKDQFRTQLIKQSKHLENTGVESKPSVRSHPGHQGPS